MSNDREDALRSLIRLFSLPLGYGKPREYEQLPEEEKAEKRLENMQIIAQYLVTRAHGKYVPQSEIIRKMAKSGMSSVELKDTLRVPWSFNAVGVCCRQNDVTGEWEYLWDGRKKPSE